MLKRLCVYTPIDDGIYIFEQLNYCLLVKK